MKINAAGHRAIVVPSRRHIGLVGRAGVFADAGLDRGLLVRADHVLVGRQWGLVEAAGVQIKHACALGGEVGVAGEDPGPVLPGFDCIRRQPAPDGGARDRGDDALLNGGSGQVRAVPAGELYARGSGQFEGQRFDRDDHLRGKTRGPSSPGLIGQSGQALLVEAFAPLGHHLSRGIQAGGDFVVA